MGLAVRHHSLVPVPFLLLTSMRPSLRLRPDSRFPLECSPGYFCWQVKCSSSVCIPMGATPVSPAAHTSHDVMAAAAKRVPPPLGSGLGKRLQLLSFQRSINGY